MRTITIILIGILVVLLFGAIKSCKKEKQLEEYKPGKVSYERIIEDIESIYKPKRVGE